MTQVRVLLVDDDPLVRTDLSMILGSAEDIELAGEASDGDEVVARVRATGPDVVDAVRTVARGDVMLSPGTTRKLVGHFVAARANPRRQRALTKLSALSDREREVVTAVAHGTVERRHSRRPLPQRGHREDPHHEDLRQAGHHQPRPADDLRLRGGRGVAVVRLVPNAGGAIESSLRGEVYKELGDLPYAVVEESRRPVRLRMRHPRE